MIRHTPVSKTTTLYRFSALQPCFCTPACLRKSLHLFQLYAGLGLCFASGFNLAHTDAAPVPVKHNVASAGGSASQVSFAVSPMAHTYVTGLTVKKKEQGPLRSSQTLTDMKELETVAQTGDARAQLLLGLGYSEGIGNVWPKCTDRATYWMQEAAKQGYVEAQVQLAYMFEAGKLGEPNATLARYWYEHAADQGHGQAQYQLGRMYHDGRGVEQNHERGAFWVELAARQGLNDALKQNRLRLVSLPLEEQAQVRERLASWKAVDYRSIEANMAEQPGLGMELETPVVVNAKRSVEKPVFPALHQAGKPLFPWVENLAPLEKQRRAWLNFLKRTPKDSSSTPNS
jgi:TPR repeat protein